MTLTYAAGSTCSITQRRATRTKRLDRATAKIDQAVAQLAVEVSDGVSALEEHYYASQYR